MTNNTRWQNKYPKMDDQCIDCKYGKIGCMKKPHPVKIENNVCISKECLNDDLSEKLIELKVIEENTPFERGWNLAIDRIRTII